MSDRPIWLTTALLSREDLPIGATEPSLHDSHALSEGTQLDEFEVIRVLGVGGFGIVYLALDRVLLRYVAIKEYLPSSLASRDATDRVTVRSAGRVETFTLGLESFINEARMLASFDHSSLVKVFRFWKANGTAYMAMQYYAGTTLKDVRSAMAAPPDAPWLRALLEPLLGALEALHREGVYHRDISPDNILLLPDGRPVLLDFGSARRVIGDRTQSLTAVLKPNFAPLEQYADEAGMRQGAWTDLFALGATLHYLHTGKTPTPAVMRVLRDELPLLAHSPLFAEGHALPAVIDWMLALAPQDRPQTVAVVRQALAGEIPVPARKAPQGAAAEPVPPVAANAEVPSDPGVAAESDVASVTPAFPATIHVPRKNVKPAELASTSDGSERVPATGARSSRRLIPIGVALALALLAGIGFTLTHRAPAANAIAAAAPVAAPAASPSHDAAASPSATALAPSVVEASAAASEPASAPAASPVASREAAMKATAVKPDTANHTSSARTASNATTERPVGPLRAAARALRGAPVTEPTPVAAAESTPAPAPAPVAVDERRPAEVCAGKGFLMRAACVRHECQAPKWHADPQCVELKAVEEMQQRRGQS